jgi:hypothetical protein
VISVERKHTPGPWFYEEDDYMWQLFGGNGIMPLQLLKAPKRDTPYAEYWPNEADANIIVAAPDMLEALRDVLKWVRTWDKPLMHDMMTTGTYDKVQKAIAKATGDNV